MRSARGLRWTWSLALFFCGACATLPSISTTPVLFSDAASTERFDFEQNAISQSPDGFEARSGHWAVVDSPSAVSGTQVLVPTGDGEARLAVKGAEAVRDAAAEVSVRVLVGSSGAGLECAAPGGGSGYVLKAEPSTARIALYRTTATGLTMLAEHALSTPKGEWVRLGMRCDASRVVAYVDGKPVLKDGSDLGAFELALCVDGGVVAQFDDFRYRASK